MYIFSCACPKDSFRSRTTGAWSGQILADQDTSFQSMDQILLQMVNIVAADPGVMTVNGFTGGGSGGGGSANTINQARMFVALKPLSERKITVDYIMQRLRPKLAKIPGATLVPAGFPGPARGRTQHRRALSIHHAGRQFAGPGQLLPRRCSRS